MRSLPRASLVIISCLFLASCSDDTCVGTYGLRTPEPDIIAPDLSEDITIGYGETVLIEEENLYVTLTGISEGRCPIGALCFWEGQAVTEFHVVVPDQRSSTVRPIIRPSSEPGTSPETTDYALGYGFTILQLDPYPDLEHDYDPEDYTAVLRIFRFEEDGPVESIIRTELPPGRLQHDPIIVREGTIQGDILTLTVSYGGGCGNHRFTLFWNPSFMESYPVQTNLFLQHDNLGDFCEAIITTAISFDIREIANEYRDVYGGYDDIILNVYGYFEGDPANGIQVTYSPE